MYLDTPKIASYKMHTALCGIPESTLAQRLLSTLLKAQPLSSIPRHKSQLGAEMLEKKKKQYPTNGYLQFPCGPSAQSSPSSQNIQTDRYLGTSKRNPNTCNRTQSREKKQIKRKQIKSNWLNDQRLVARVSDMKKLRRKH